MLVIKLNSILDRQKLNECVKHTDFDRNSEGWQLNDYWELFWHEVENEVFN